MKATNRDYLQVAQRAGGALAIHFLCGQDEAGAQAAVGKVLAAQRDQGRDPGERVDLSGAELKADPVRLVDEARSTSLFGGARHILARVAGDEAHDAVKTFLDMADLGETGGACPVYVVATSATDKSRTAKLLLGRKDAVVAIFYAPDLKSVTADVRAMADAAGLKRMGGDLAERIARAVNLDVRLAQSEIDKLALYMDASPQNPAEVNIADYEQIGATTDENDVMPLVNAVFSGEVRRLPGELARMREVGLNPVGVALALERRAAQLAALVAKRQRGQDIQELLESQRVFFRDKRDLDTQLRRWPAARLDRLVPRLAELHRSLIGNSQMAELVLAQELARIARFAAAGKR